MPGQPLCGLKHLLSHTGTVYENCRPAATEETHWFAIQVRKKHGQSGFSFENGCDIPVSCLHPSQIHKI